MHWNNEGADAEGNLSAVGFCQENADAGQVETGDVCVAGMIDGGNGEMFEWPFINNCPAGDLCIPLAQGQPPVCIDMCDPLATENTCADGLSCVQLQIESVGICVQQ